MTFVKNSFKIRENLLKFAKNWVKFANFKLQNEECHHYEKLFMNTFLFYRKPWKLTCFLPLVNVQL